MYEVWNSLASSSSTPPPFKDFGSTSMQLVGLLVNPAAPSSYRRTQHRSSWKFIKCSRGQCSNTPFVSQDTAQKLWEKFIKVFSWSIRQLQVPITGHTTEALGQRYQVFSRSIQHHPVPIAGEAQNTLSGQACQVASLAFRDTQSAAARMQAILGNKTNKHMLQPANDIMAHHLAPCCSNFVPSVRIKVGVVMQFSVK